jgi:hypothetical protein
MLKHAILLPCLLRCIDDNLLSFLDSARDAKLFVVTEKAFAAEAQLLVDKYDADCIYIENAINEYIDILFDDATVVHPEFIKLQLALRRVCLFENKSGHRFRYIHRFRTDVIYPVSFEEYIWPLRHEGYTNDFILAHWSICYSGGRDIMMKLSDFPAFCRQYKTDRLFFERVVASINIFPLKNSQNPDPFLASFPVAILNDTNNAQHFHGQVKIEYPCWIDAVDAFRKRLRLESAPHAIHQQLVNRDLTHIRTYFDRWKPWISESPFFYYLNSLNIATNGYSVLNPFVNTPLKFARHATTLFTRTIFEYI